MKDNNINITKNDDINDIKYKPEGQITRSVYELLKNSKNGDFDKLKLLIDEKAFQGSTLNLALRNLINSFKPNYPSYLKCYKFLLSTNIDLNYKYPKDNNSTILMNLSKLGEIILIKELLEHEYTQVNTVNNIFHTNGEEIEYEIAQKELLFTQKDSDNKNFLHYLIHINFNEIESINIFEYLFEIYPFKNKNEEISNKIQDIFKKLLLETNNDGDNFINICLLYRCPKLILKIIDKLGFTQNINKKKNNYIHSAILGKNLACLKIILHYSNLNDLYEKNIDNLTPPQLADKLGYHITSSIINEIQNNFNEDGKDNIFKRIEISDKAFEEKFSIDFLINFFRKEFRQLLYELNELKIINNLCIEGVANNTEEDLFYKISNLKIQWNIILIKICDFDYDKELDNNNYYNTNNNKINKYNKKKSKKLEEKNKNTIFPYFKAIQDLNENNFSDKIILSFINMTNTISNNLININQNIDLLLYNKIIFYFKLGNFNSVLDTAEIYLTQIYLKNCNINTNFNNISLILYVNITFILIEIFIYQEYYTISEVIIKSLDKYLETKSLNFGDTVYTLDDKIIFNYLNKNDLLNPFLSNWNELFNYSNLLRLLISKEKSKDIIEDLRKKIDISKSKNEIPISNRIEILFCCTEIKKMYEKDDAKIYDKISELKNIDVNYEIYYFNIIGIMCLKRKKYNLSKMFFIKGLNKYIQIIKNKNNINNANDTQKNINFRIDYITAFLYNICLCNFYLREFNNCIKILELLLLFKNNKNNYFFYYRLGMCYLQIYIDFNKNNCDCYNKNILRLIGYEKNKNNYKKTKNEKPISIDLDNLDNDSTENLSYQLDLELRDNNIQNRRIDDNKNIFSNNKKNEINNISNFKDNNIKRIFLKNTTKNINNNAYNYINKNMIKNNIYNNDNISINTKNKNDNIKIDFLCKSIECFKKIIIISKTNTHTNSGKSIYNFYLRYIKDDINEKDNINNQKRKKIPNELIIDTYLNLLLCLSLKNNWLEIIFIIKDFNNRRLSSNKSINLKVLLFKLEAYINLNNSAKIKETINKLKNYKKIEFSVFNKANNDIINNINIKLYLYYTLTLIFIKEKNYKEMDIYVDKLLLLINEEKNIPYYIIDLLINVFLIKLNNEPNLNETNKFKYNNIILNLIKNKKTNILD